MIISEKITLAISVWMIFILFITGNASLEIFFILIIIGFIIIKELTDHLTTNIFKKKMNAFIFVFMIAFLFLVGKRLIEFLEI
jgi:hypothetical protein